AAHHLSEIDFLIGTVPGCDLRLPGANLPAVVCLIHRHPGGVVLRKLAPVQQLLVNESPVTVATLADGDRITVGEVDLLVSVVPARNPLPALQEHAEELEARARDLDTLREHLEDQR